MGLDANNNKAINGFAAAATPIELSWMMANFFDPAGFAGGFKPA